MSPHYSIPHPFTFNLLKHHKAYIKQFITRNRAARPGIAESDVAGILNNIGSSVCDVYTGNFSIIEITNKIQEELCSKGHFDKKSFLTWTGVSREDYSLLRLSDNSEWILKYLPFDLNYIHIFPARKSEYSIRIKSNTLKTAIMISIYTEPGTRTLQELNRLRAVCNLSPCKAITNTQASIKLAKELTA